jgi:hypothetical protein
MLCAPAYRPVSVSVQGLSMPLLMKWANSKTNGDPGAHISNFNVSLKDGLALCAIIHATNKSLLCWVDLDKARVLFPSVQFPRVLSKGSR